MLSTFDPQALFEANELEAIWQRLINYDCPYRYCHGAKGGSVALSRNIFGNMDEIHILLCQW
jgi:hypothetical protein